jgi:UDP-N-acetylmuramoyl-tripeptide--D-alanyl-D-alanine ligase
MQPFTIAITGSQGKTNTAYILSKLFPKAVVTDIDLDTIYNVPITALKIKQVKQLAIFELGIDHIGEMEKHLKIIKPNISIITGISPVHADEEHLGSLDKIIEEKRKMIEILTPADSAILNFDDKNVREMSTHTKAKVFFYGSDKEQTYVYTDANLKTGDNYKLTTGGTTFNIYVNNKKLVIHTKLIGVHHISNIMASYIAFTLVNKDKFHDQEEMDQEFINLIKDIEPLKGRMRLEDGPQGLKILDDSLRANITSTKLGLLTFNEIESNIGRKIAVIGEMGEIGELEEEIHSELGRYISELKNIDYVIGIGPLLKITQQEAFKNGMADTKFYWAKDILVASGILKLIAKENDIIYLKASLLRHLERILLILQEKEVNCSVLSCPLYNKCSKCKYLATGYPNE